jgi:hypothetical protein
MKNTRQTLLLAPLLLAVTMGSTDCEYFGETTVPASDPSPPTSYDGVWRGGEYVAIGASYASSGITYHFTPGQTVIAVSSAIDTEGVRKVTLSGAHSWQCCQGNICSSTSSASTPITDTQSGSVGSTVSNGIWVGQAISQLPTCNSGYTLKHYRFAWTTYAENFYGGKVTSPVHQIVYP